MTALKRIEREPLWDLAHTQLQDALLAGRFELGKVLTLRSLAESFGTSITPVRDAVTRLVAQGVLQQGPRNSAIVPNLMYATGHYRNGVMLAPLTAQLVADMMLENRTDPMLASLSASRFGEL